MNISVELAQKIVNYLATKPFNEVSGLISEIVQSKSNSPENKLDDSKK